MDAADQLGIGDRIRSARRRLDWSRDTLATRAGLSSSAIAQLESGRRKHTRPTTLSALARALGLSIDYLVNGTASPALMLRHRVMSFRLDDDFTTASAPYLAGAAERSEAALAVFSERNSALLKKGLGGAARRVEFREAETWYESPIGAIESYRDFLDERLEAGAPWLRVAGEAIWGDSPTEIRMWAEYESVANIAFAYSPVSLFCFYDEKTVSPAIVDTARVTHPEIVENGKVTANASYRDPCEFLLS